MTKARNIRAQRRPTRRGPRGLDRSIAMFLEKNVTIPREEARRYERRYGAAAPYPDCHAYDRGRMSATEHNDTPDSLAHHFARAERTPPCVRGGLCKLNDHGATCPLVDEQEGD